MRAYRHPPHQQAPLNPATGGRPRLAVLPLLPLLSMLVLHAGGAAAQISGSVALATDYRFRGVSLSDGEPAGQLNLNYDSPAGWYLGAQAAAPVLSERNGAQLIGYAGLARRLSSGWSWEGGVNVTSFVRAHEGDYAEWYGGLAGERIGMRIYLSPHYLGRDLRTAYAELNGFYPLADDIKLIGHLGQLRALPGGERQPVHYDARLGIAANWRDWSAQLAWVAAAGGAARPSYYAGPATHAAVFNVAWSF